jgi:hypothetical protein
MGSVLILKGLISVINIMKNADIEVDQILILTYFFCYSNSKCGHSSREIFFHTMKNFRQEVKNGNIVPPYESCKGIKFNDFKHLGTGTNLA